MDHTFVPFISTFPEFLNGSAAPRQTHPHHHHRAGRVCSAYVQLTGTNAAGIQRLSPSGDHGLLELAVRPSGGQNGGTQVLTNFGQRSPVMSISASARSQRRLCVLLLWSAALSESGCDQAGDVLHDVKSTVTGQQEAAVSENESTKSTPPQTTDTAPAVATPQPPAEVLSGFTKLKPHEITDGALESVVSSAEAAASITKLELQGEDVTGDGLKHLRLMPNLHSLTISNGRMSTAELAHIAYAASLRNLYLGGSKSDDELIEQLAALEHLETLELWATQISPGAASGLSKMKNLKVLDCSGTRIDDTTVAGLLSLPLRSLNLSKTKITNASIPVLLNIQTLESLSVAQTEVTGASFKGYNRAGLKQLDVGATQFGIDGFAAIKGMKSLEELNVHDAGLVEHTKANVFRTFPKLKILNAGANSITDAGMKVFFKGHRSLEHLNLEGNRWITNNGLGALVAVKSLKRLDVKDTVVGETGARALKERLPDCSIITSTGSF